ncbi:glutathione synthetase, chloroplastic isoform X2 [Rhodamnia argentea]|uniref:Glutathione synthetase n=1 Tax=Rhodamnia argentea TaxID=178133 RepID=A0ABM3GTL3_9MYRT|nr:glutathione synthetase, chloroplastic isoform X2 [Rhodamnia argentea]
MGAVHSSSLALSTDPRFVPVTSTLPPCVSKVSKSKSNSSLFGRTRREDKILGPPVSIFTSTVAQNSIFSESLPLKCARFEMGTKNDEVAGKPTLGFVEIDQDLVDKMVYDALVWSSLHGLVVGDRNVKISGKVPGVGLVHAPFALLPISFPESHFREACELAPIFNELVDRVSLDGKFLQYSLSRTKKVDAFTSRLLDIHSKMMESNKKYEIRLGLHRSDYMLDEQTKSLLQIELNTISSSFPGLSCLVSELHRSLLNHYGETLGLDPRRIPANAAVSRYAEALAKAWIEFNNPKAAVLVVVQMEERNMYDQHWLCSVLRERYNVRSIRKTLAEIDAEAKLQPDGTLLVGGVPVAVIYFRAGYTPNDYPSESEWRARLLMEESAAIKFLDNKEDIAKVRKCFAGLWSLEDPDIIGKAIESPELFVMKPQREGGGNNIYDGNVRETLLRLQREGTEEDAAYILMQRIFPTISPTTLIRDGICYKDHAVSELGVYGAYLRNKENLIVNEQCGYLMRTKTSSSNEGGVAAGFAVLDSLYLT